MPPGLLLPRGPASSWQGQPATSPPGGGPYVVSAYKSFMNDGFGNGFAFTTDTDVQPGDWAICCVTDSQVNTLPVAPTGVDRWQLLHTNSSSTNFEANWYALYNPKPSTTYTWSITGGRRSIVAAVIRGADPYQLLDGAASSLATGTAPIHNSNTVVTAGDWRLLLAFPVLRAFPSARWIPDSTWRMWTEAFGADATTNMDAALLARPAQTAGSYSQTFGLVGGEPAIVGLLAIRPLGASPTPYNVPSTPTHPGAGPSTARFLQTLGSTFIAAASSGTAEGGTAAVGLTVSGTAVHVGQLSGSAGLGLTATGAAKKIVAVSGTCGLGLVAAGTAAKRVPAAGPSALGLAGTSVDRKVGVEAGSTPLGLVGAGTDKKLAAERGLGALSLTTLGAGTKKAPQAGTDTLGLVGTHSGTVARLQTGTTALGLGTSGVGRKLAAKAGSGVLGIAGTGVDKKQAIQRGAGTLGLAGRVATGIDTRAVAGRTTLGFWSYNHNCTTHRPVGGTTVRPGTGTTTRTLATTVRPSTGVTSRPNAGTTTDPC